MKATEQYFPVVFVFTFSSVFFSFNMATKGKFIFILHCGAKPKSRSIFRPATGKLYFLG